MAKRSLEEKFNALFETARRSLFAADLTANRLMTELGELESPVEAQEDIGSRAIAPLVTAAGFVDFAHRFGSIMDSLPMVNKKSTEMRALRNVLKDVEIARNHLQHMRGDLASNEQIDYPVLGALSWVNGEWCFSMCAAQPYQADFPSIAFNTQTKQWATTCQYTVKRISIDVPRTLRQMHAAYEWLISHMTFSNPSDAALTWGQTHSLRFRLFEAPAN